MSDKLFLPLACQPAPERKLCNRTPEQAWLDWAAAEWEAFHQAPMTVRRARDLALIRPLLRLHGPEELKRRWAAFVATLDEYFARRGWDIPCFSASIDRYRGGVDRVPLVRRRQLLEAEANDRDPLTGVSLRARSR